MNSGPVLAVSALIVRDGRLLLVRRGPQGAFPGAWSLPGGKVDRGETMRDALRREVHEETGLEAAVGDQVAIHEAIGDAGHHVIVVFRAQAEGDPAPGDDAAAAEWVAFGDVLGRELTPGLAGVLRDAGIEV